MFELISYYINSRKWRDNKIFNSGAEILIEMVEFNGVSYIWVTIIHVHYKCILNVSYTCTWVTIIHVHYKCILYVSYTCTWVTIKLIVLNIWMQTCNTFIHIYVVMIQKSCRIKMH